MRSGGWEDLARLAYDSAAATLDSPRFRRVLGSLAA
jgi:hypothetical protein